MRLPPKASLGEAVSAVLDGGKLRTNWAYKPIGNPEQQSDDIAVLIQAARRPGVRFELTGSDTRLRRAGLTPGRRVAYGPGFLAGTLVRVGKVARLDEIEIAVLPDGPAEAERAPEPSQLTFARPDGVRLANGGVEFWGDDPRTGARVRCILSRPAVEALQHAWAGSGETATIAAAIAAVGPLAGRIYQKMREGEVVFLGLSRVQTAPETRLLATRLAGTSPRGW